MTKKKDVIPAKAGTKIKIDPEKCKGCMLCISVCPQHIITVSKNMNKRGLQYVVVKDTDKCTGCGLCFTICPDCVIEISEKKKENKK